MHTAKAATGLAALSVLLFGCGAAPSRSSATYTAANAVAAPAPPVTRAPTPARAPALAGSVVDGVPYAAVGSGRIGEGPLAALARRTTGPVTLRTFTQPWPYSARACDVLNQQCPPPWCVPTGSVVTELSTEAMAAVRTSPVIGLGPGSKVSVLTPRQACPTCRQRRRSGQLKAARCSWQWSGSPPTSTPST